MSRGAGGTGPLLEAVRAALEESLLVLSERRDADELTEALRLAIAQLSGLIEAEPGDAEAIEALEGLERTSATVEAARERLQGDEATSRRIEGAERWLAEASEQLRDRLRERASRIEGTKKSDEILASVGVPRTHHVDVPAPRVLSREDQAAEAARAGALLDGPPAAAGELAQVRAIARDCFEDIASLGSLRRLYDSEPWIDAGPFEQRLLDDLDALVALERPLDPRSPPLGLVEALFAYATEWKVPDFGRTFALAFTLSCLASETAMRWVVLALRRSHPRTYPAFVDALALGSNEAIERTLVELCADDDPAIVAVALEAMARRGRADMASTVLLLMRPGPDLVRKAIDLAARLPAQAAAPLLSRFLEGSDPVTSAGAAAALTTLGDARGPKHLRALLKPPRDQDPATLRARRIALETLCLLGSPFDRQLVAAEASAAPEGLPWLGWYGHPEHVPLLAEALRCAAKSGGAEEADRFARALERIGGGAAPRPGGAGDGELEAGLAAWARSFEERRPPGVERLRSGLPWTAGAIVSELAAPGTRQGERPVLARELALATRRAAHVDVEGWVAAQQRELAACRDLLARQT